MTALINYLDYQMRMTKATENLTYRKTFYEQAFGAVQYHLFLYPNDQEKIELLWGEVYRPQFEKLVYGV